MVVIYNQTNVYCYCTSIVKQLVALARSKFVQVCFDKPKKLNVSNHVWLFSFGRRRRIFWKKFDYNLFLTIAKKCIYIPSWRVNVITIAANRGVTYFRNCSLFFFLFKIIFICGMNFFSCNVYRKVVIL